MNATKLLRAGPQLAAMFQRFEAIRTNMFNCMYSVQKMNATTAMAQFKDLKTGLANFTTELQEFERAMADDAPPTETPPTTS